MFKASRMWPHKSIDAAVAAERKVMGVVAVLYWTSAFLAIFAIWLSVWAEHALPAARIDGPTLPQAIFWTVVNIAVAVGVNALARHSPEMFRRRFQLLQERKANAEQGDAAA